MKFNAEKDALHPAYGFGAWVMFLSLAIILTALAFEFIGGYKPCPLCLQQRYAYYAAIPVAFVALILIAGDYSRVAAALFFAVSLAFVANAGLAAYHAGIEWGFWTGPATCSGTTAPPASVDELFKGLETESGVRCDEAQWRFFGLSFADWNVVLSLLLSLIAMKAAIAAKSMVRA